MAQIGETELDVGTLSRALWRRAWLLALLAVLAALGAYVGLGFIDPLYTADARILIEERESPLSRTRDQSAEPALDFDESAIQSQVEVLKSRQIANAVIDKLDLTRRPEFDPARQPSVFKSLLVVLGLAKHPADSTIRQRVIDSYLERLSVYPVQKSRVIGVEFSAPDPVLAAEVANAIAEGFVELQQDAKRQSAIAATEWLQQEIERLRSRVAEAEQAVADYRATHGLFDVEQRGVESGNLSTQQLGDLNAELARARAARAEAEARADLVQTLLNEGGALDASEEVLNSQLIQRLRERQGALRAQIAELSTTLLPAHPRIRALGGQVANLETQIRQETEKVLASLKTAARVARAREQSLVSSLNEAKVDVTRSNDQEIQLRALEREAAAQRDLLESFLGRYREATARTDADYVPADARIISAAVAPGEPSFPKKAMMATAAALAVLLIGIAVVLMLELISGRAFRVIGPSFAEPYPAPPAPAPAPPMTPLLAARIGAEPDSTLETSRQPEPPRSMRQESVAAPKDSPSLEEPPEQEPLEREGAEAPLPGNEVADQAGIPEVLSTEDEAAEPPQSEERVEDAVTADDLSESELIDDEPPAEEPEQPVGEAASAPVDMESDLAGTAELAEIIANSAVRLALFVGAVGGEGAGDIAFSAARRVAREKLRCVLVDVGRAPSHALGNERPGLGDLLTGEASFGEAIRRDDATRVHTIPLGVRPNDAQLQRLQLVIGALTHTYDKVIVIADRLDDWPDEHVRPDVAAIVCGPETTDAERAEIYENALARGAHNVIIVRYTGEFDTDGEEKTEAA